MIGTKHFTILLARLLSNGSVVGYVSDQGFWYTDGYFAFASTQPIINPELVLDRSELVDSLKPYYNGEATQTLILTGTPKKVRSNTCLELSGADRNVWVNKKYQSLFPEKRYRYSISEATFSPVYCTNINTAKLEGLIMPIRMKED